MQLLVQSRARLRKNVLRAGRVHGSKPIDLNGRSKVRSVRIQRGSGAMVMKVGASKAAERGTRERQAGNAFFVASSAGKIYVLTR